MASKTVLPALPDSGEDRKALRIVLGLTQRQVAEAVGTRVDTVGGWEKGARPAPHFRDKYAAVLGCS